MYAYAATHPARFNQVQFKASHNSYVRDESLAEQMAFDDEDHWQGGCRGLEFDIRPNDDATRSAGNLQGNDHKNKSHALSLPLFCGSSGDDVRSDRGIDAIAKWKFSRCRCIARTIRPEACFQR